MFFYSLIFCFLIFAYLRHASTKRLRDAVANIPGPFCLPVLGAVHKFFELTPENFIPCCIKYDKIYGGVLRVWALNRLIVISSDVELNEQILASSEHLVKHRNYRMLEQWLGTGLLLSDGRKWFKRRKIITPSFQFKILEQFVEVFDQQSNVFIQKLAKKADGKSVFNIYSVGVGRLWILLRAFKLNCEYEDFFFYIRIPETAMGTKIHAQSDSSTEYANAVNRLTKIIAWRFMSLHLSNELMFTILCPFLKWETMKLKRVLHKFTTKMIEEHRRYSLNDKTTFHSAENLEIVGSKKRLALLDVLLQSEIDGKPLSNEDIREEVDTFMFAGHDTTTSAMSFAFHLIARHSEVQTKLLEEVQSVLGNDCERSINLRDLNELKYCEYVIKETLRMYPSVPMIGRELLKDFKYSHSKLGNGFIPAGAEFLITIYGMMNNSEYFELANEFLPERHINKEKMGAFLMISFSAGPRNCIGHKFAMLEMKMMIAKTVREYELLPLGEDVSPELNIVLRSSNGWQLGMKKREPKCA